MIVVSSHGTQSGLVRGLFASVALAAGLCLAPVSSTGTDLSPARRVVAPAWLTNEALCGPLAGTRAAVFPVSSNQPESTRRMVARLNEVFQKFSGTANAFRSVELAAFYADKLARATEPRDKIETRLPYARQLLQAGHSEAAAREFENFERMLKEAGGSLGPKGMLQVSTWKAMSHLRLGEQENCLANHNADSCLLPIQDGGIHKLPRGSRAAVEILTQSLQTHPADKASRWLLNIAYMTLGEYPDKVPPPWLIPPRAFASEYDIKRFPDVAGKVGLDIDGYAGGVVMDDFDNDGFLDLMVSDWDFRGQLRVFRNNGDATFTERTVEAGLAGLCSGLNLIQGDYNNDGRPDVLVLRGAWLGASGNIPNSLLRNNGDFTFTDVTEEAGLLSHRPTQTAVWFDYNNDGWLDIFIGNESSRTNNHPCELFRNNGNGTFTECAAENGLAAVAFVKGAASGDFNNDGRPDLYVSIRGAENMLFRNDGPAGASRTPRAPWRFTNVAQAAGVTQPINSFPCWFFDYDNDGWLDLMVTGYAINDAGDIAAEYLGQRTPGTRSRLFRNKGDGTFEDVSVAAGVYKVLHTMGCNFGDLDNDGWLDFYCATGDPDITTLIPNRMFRNNAGRRFQCVTTSGGFGQLQKGHAIAFGDIDNDGDQDIYSVVGGAYVTDNYRKQLFANPGHGNRWLKLKLEGVQSNRSARGARIKVVAQSAEGERAIRREVTSGASFGANPLMQEIGLGAATNIARIEIFWPVTGRTQLVQNVRIDSRYTIREGDSGLAPAPFRYKTFPLPTSPGAPDRHHGHTASSHAALQR